MKKLLIATCLVNLAAAISAHADVIIQDMSLEGLTYSAPGPGATAQYMSAPTGDYAYITTPDSETMGGSAQFTDTGMVVVDNGYDGVALGTLDSFVAAGANGDVSFNNAAEGGNNGEFAYWAVTLVDPNNSANTFVVNAYSDNMMGANPFNQGVPLNSSVLASTSSPSGQFTFGSPWSTVETVTDDGTVIGTWDVSEVAIEVGGWGSDVASSAEITSIKLPGTLVVPEPSTWALLIGGIVVLGAMRRHRLGGL
jgi:hypothetical protein